MTQSPLSDQYAPAEIRKYEAIYGRHFVSPGGEGCARDCVTRLNLAPGDRVLDVGSGLGGSAFLMATDYGARVHGIDLSADMVALATQKCRQQGLQDLVSFEKADCLDLTVSQVYEAIYSRDVILHIENKARLFQVLRAALVPGGRLLITDYCRGEGESSAEFDDYVAQRGYHLVTVVEYTECLRQAGLEAVLGEDWTARFIDIHRRELQRLPSAGLDADEESAMRQHWQEKIARAERGEQCWGLFTARRENQIETN